MGSPEMGPRRGNSERECPKPGTARFRRKPSKTDKVRRVSEMCKNCGVFSTARFRPKPSKGIPDWRGFSLEHPLTPVDLRFSLFGCGPDHFPMRGGPKRGGVLPDCANSILTGSRAGFLVWLCLREGMHMRSCMGVCCQVRSVTRELFGAARP